MKKIILALVILFYCTICFAQKIIKKEFLIPLNNATGVPFLKDIGLNDIAIGGFEIDSKDNFYFLAGHQSVCLAVFSGSKQLYRKSYSNFKEGALYINNEKLFAFNRIGSPDLLVINPMNGTLIKRYSNLWAERPNGVFFKDSCVIFEKLGLDKSTYKVYDLAGNFIKTAATLYNVPASIIPKSKDRDYKLVGFWNNNYIFWSLTGDDLREQTFCVVDETGKIIQKKILPNDGTCFGHGYAGFQEEYMKVRHGNLYVLGRRGKNALITEVPLTTFFNK